jgi:hypothetical protein
MDEREYIICEECGEQIFKDEAIETAYGTYICKTCYDEKYFTCDDCGCVYKEEDGEETYSGIVCHDCLESVKYSRCDHCDTWCSCLDGELTYIADTQEYVCEHCRDNYYVQCDDCGEWFSELNEGYNDYFYCDGCYENHCSIISDYHDNPTEIHFFGDTHNDTVPYLGVELEIDKGNYDRDECAKNIQNCFPDDDFIYFEEDGSLNDGFENITQPATLEYHTSLEKSYRNAFAEAISKGFRSHNTTTCGLHVHFNKNFFAENEDLYTTRLLYIVEKFWDELTKFSRRSLSNLDRWAKKYDISPEKVIEEKKKYNLSRYQAVNLTNSNTIEFRMFRGTLRYETFIATLQLVNTMVITAKTIDSTEAIQNLKWEDLLQYDEVKAYWETVKNREVR